MSERKTIDESMSKAIGAMYDQERSARNQRRADLWKRNPITGKTVKEKYNDRCNGSMR